MKVLVLGGGYCQLNMIKRLKDEGHHIILVDYLKNNPSKKYVDEYHCVSTFDASAVLELMIKSKAEAIITMGTDQPVLTAASVAKEVGIPFYVDPDIALAVTNKRIMKAQFDRHHIPTANYRLITREFTERNVLGIKFPAVLKPVDSQGQRGIFIVQNVNDIRMHIDETLDYSRESKVLLEEYYPNDEITVNGWVHEGKAYIISVVDRVTMEKDNRIGICIAHNYPSLHFPKYREDIYSITQSIVTGFGIKEGPLYFQYLIGDRGVIVNEIAMRIGGAYEDIAIPIYSDIDILGLVINNSLGVKSDLQKLSDYNLNCKSDSLSVQMFFIRPGLVSYMTPVKELLAIEGVENALYIVSEGNKIGDIENATARAGYFIIRGVDYKDTMSKVYKVFEKLQIKDSYGKNMVIKYSEYENKYKFI